MSDTGRKPLTDKVSEAVKPDSEKTTFERAKEGVTDTVDSFASKATPNDQKSFTQNVADSTKEGHDDAKAKVGEHEATFAETALTYVEAAKEQVANAANYVSGVVTGATEGAKQATETSEK